MASATSRREPSSASSSSGAPIGMGSKPAAFSSAATGARSSAGRAMTTAWRATFSGSWMVTGRPRSGLGLGVARGDLDRAVVAARHSGLEAGERGDRVAERDVGAVMDREDELAVGTGRDAHRLDAGQAAEMTLEAGDAGD